MKAQKNSSNSPLTVVELDALTVLPDAAHEFESRLRVQDRNASTSGAQRIQTATGGRRVLLFDGETCVAMGTVRPSEESRFMLDSGLTPEDLTESASLEDVLVEPSCEEVIRPILMYMLLRRVRIWQRHTVVAYLEDGRQEGESDLFGWQKLEHLPDSSQSEGSAPLRPVAQRLDLAIHRSYEACSAHGRETIRKHFLPEAIETLEIHIERLFSNEFFQSVYDASLTKEQYIYSMSNLHQFVRYTTRLIGRAVGLSNDEELRNHWLSHLEGEINHEKIIEKDLLNLGADVNYVVHSMLPNVHNQEFMVLQESVIAFHQDPVLFMAAPFSAEGWTARLDQRFMNGLEKAARSWGIEQPRHVTSFLASHIHFDGGEDGHWKATCSILDNYLTDDLILQKFLNLVHLSMNAFERSYASYVTEQRLWSAKPTRQPRSARAAVGS